MLDADYELECFTDGITSLWWIIAAASAVGLVVVSLGLPLSMYYVMRRDWQVKLREVKQQRLSMPAAYRHHTQKFAYICGEFRPQACALACNCHRMPPLADLFADACVIGWLRQTMQNQLTSCASWY